LSLTKRSAKGRRFAEVSSLETTRSSNAPVTIEFPPGLVDLRRSKGIKGHRPGEGEPNPDV